MDSEEYNSGLTSKNQVFERADAGRPLQRGSEFFSERSGFLYF